MKLSNFLIFVFVLLAIGCTSQAAVEDVQPTAIAVGGDTAVPPTPTLISPTLMVEVTKTAVSPTAIPTETLQPPTPTSAPPTAAPTLDVTARTETLKEIMTATLQSENDSDAPFAGYEGLYAAPLPFSQGPPLWLVHSIGFRSFDPMQNHFVAVFVYENGSFREIGRVDLEFPDILFDHSAMSEERNGRLWLEVESGVGAHGGCYNLLRVDQGILIADEAHCHSSPGGVGYLSDLNQDGSPDIVLNNTNDYVFCYACSIRLPDYTVKSWNGNFWEPIELAFLSSPDPEIILSNEAVAMANAGLWQDAERIMNNVTSQDPTVIWNRILINLHAESHREFINYDIYPFLQNIFYGDYDAALAPMRPFTVEALFSDPQSNPMMVGSPTEGMPDILADWIIVSTENALSVQPDLAAAHFLRGWGTFLIAPSDPGVIEDIERAVSNAPDEPLYNEALSYLRSISP